MGMEVFNSGRASSSLLLIWILGSVFSVPPVMTRCCLGRIERTFYQPWNKWIEVVFDRLKTFPINTCPLQEVLPALKVIQTGCVTAGSRRSLSVEKRSDTNIIRRPVAKSSLHYSVDCGIQNSDQPFEKIFSGSEQSGRIVGGSDADPGEFPWQVSIQGIPPGAPNRRYVHKCGGSIITEDIIVTAGHCVHGETASSLRVVAGADDIYSPTGTEQIRRVKSYISEFQLGWDSPIDDIAVVILDKSLKFNSSVAPVCLPDADFVYNGGQAVITGWGTVTETGEFPHVLQAVQVPLISRERCQEKLRKFDNRAIRECNLCAGSSIGGRDSCQGDSGGPLTCVEDDGRHYLCGVVSWGIGCGRAESPGVYTLTSCFSNWIKQAIAIHITT